MAVLLGSLPLEADDVPGIVKGLSTELTSWLTTHKPRPIELPNGVSLVLGSGARVAVIAQG
jgi:hypothetical protein